jgi:hypothetical protein
MENFKRIVAIMLAVALISATSGRVEASLAPARLQAENQSRASDLQTVQTFLEQKEVRDHLAKLNMSASDIETRLGNLSDQELHQVAMKIQFENPGRDGAVGILVVVILVLLIIYLAKRI